MTEEFIGNKQWATSEEFSEALNSREHNFILNRATNSVRTLVSTYRDIVSDVFIILVADSWDH